MNFWKCLGLARWRSCGGKGKINGTQGQEKNVGQGREARKLRVSLENPQSFVQREGERREGKLHRCVCGGGGNTGQELALRTTGSHLEAGKVLVTLVFSRHHVGQFRNPFELL